MRFEVTAVSIDKNDRRLKCERKEVIDTDTNDLFATVNDVNCGHEYFVEKIYEAFWNIPSAIEIVKVIDVKVLD